MKILKNTISMAAAAIMAAAAASCSTDNSGGNGGGTMPDNMFYDFATYNGSTENSSSFEVQKNTDSGQATITFNNTFKDNQLKTGSRVYMAYTTLSGKQYQSGPGTLYVLRDVTGGAPVEATDELRVRASDAIKLAEMKRTGDYLNIIFQVPMSGSALNRLALTQKPNEKEPAYPMLGLYVDTPNDMAPWQYVQASFDVSDVLAPADVEGFKVEYFDDKGIDTLTFVKNSMGGITPIE